MASTSERPGTAPPGWSAPIQSILKLPTLYANTDCHASGFGESAVHGAAVRQLELVITLALNQLTVAAALVYWPKPVGKHGGYDEYGASATAAMMQKYGSV